MARGDPFFLFLVAFFFIQGLIAFVGFALLARLLNYRASKDKPMSWRIAGSIGVVIWTVRNIYVHAWSEALGWVDLDGARRRSCRSGARRRREPGT
jgi:hypothetical protein